eukprot:CFRG0758T1
MLEHLNENMKPKPELLSGWWDDSVQKRRLDTFSSDAVCKKKPRIQQRWERKSVHFEDSELEEVFFIPAKEETWPYGSLYGDSLPRAFEEFDHLYGCPDKKDGCKTKSLSQPKEVAFTLTVGHAYLMYDGSILKAVCSTTAGFIGKKFVKHECIEEELTKFNLLKSLRPADYIETDEYVAIVVDNIAVNCTVSCIGDDSKSIEGMKTFYFSWCYSRELKSVLPYALERKVEVYWNTDQTWYEGVVEDARDGLHRVTYTADESVEWINLNQFEENGHLRFL